MELYTPCIPPVYLSLYLSYNGEWSMAQIGTKALKLGYEGGATAQSELGG